MPMSRASTSRSASSAAARRRGALLLYLLPVLCGVLDLIALIGDHTDPSALGQFACKARAFGAPASAIMPREWLDFVSDYCSGLQIEPVISIIFFEIKISLGIVSILVFWGIIILGLIKALGTSIEELRSTDVVKAVGLFGGTLGIPTALLWFILLSGRPEKYASSFSASVFDKVSEDAVVYCLYLLGMLVGAPILLAIMSPVIRKVRATGEARR
ncbi:MAG TPA: hypothetical protein VMF12_08540 [Xanthobacteraceae bacterium]|nr:hypothetical protein [Xanthobacteraceae bacterium]HUC66599.1 hypothetical protein [Stellaceae bacterium]